IMPFGVHILTFELYFLIKHIRMMHIFN
ncbi:hypothetical protein, partial [Plasmodium yoelii yoelii]